MSTGVLLMTYGAPRDERDVPEYLARVRGGRATSAEIVAEMTRRYRVIGGSPLVRVTNAQAAALEHELGEDYRVRAAMRFSAPTVRDAVGDLAREVDALVGIVLSPQWSDLLMSGYRRALEEAAAESGLRWDLARAWYDEPLFVELIATLVREARESLDRPAILLTAHSIPRRVHEAEPGYVAQLRETADLVARAAGLAEGDWRFAFQSAGHTQEEWLRPDLVELFPELHAIGARSVLVVPIQFLADHLEVLYDLDVAARAQAEAAGLEYHRIAMPNDRPELARALARVARLTSASVTRVPSV
ncbi:MAG TPA: ferrochelatase [Candidatus Limnocylindria bacterium]|nr:ferrochelatase [Candidatus Limnocylindria bacterium]